jgi:hypothetical protein
VTNDEIAQIAQQVSVLLQLDRTRHTVSSQLDMSVLANVPAYISSVFEKANEIDPALDAASIYSLINKRVSEMQAQIYLLRLELENRDAHDPANIYADPMVISAYAERIDAIVGQPRSYSFGPEILASGWYPTENNGDVFFRWMRPVDTSLACVPHLGAVDQTLVTSGYVAHADQIKNLTISAFGKIAKIENVGQESSNHWTATLDFTAKDLEIANYAPVEFKTEDFRQPNEADTRLLGACVSSFTLTPKVAE